MTNSTISKSSMSKDFVDALPLSVVRLGAEICWDNVELPWQEKLAHDKAFFGEGFFVSMSIIIPLIFLIFFFRLSKTVFWFLLSIPIATAFIHICSLKIKSMIEKKLQERQLKQPAAYSKLPVLGRLIGIPTEEITHSDLFMLALNYWGRTHVEFAAAASVYRKKKQAKEALRIAENNRRYERNSQADDNYKNYDSYDSYERHERYGRSDSDGYDLPSINPGSGFPQLTPGGIDAGGYAPGDGPY